MRVKIPIKIRWNEARKQWDVLFLGSHLQEFGESETQAEFFECGTVKALVNKLQLDKTKDNSLIMELRKG